MGMGTSIEDRARVGVPYRTAEEEAAGDARKHEFYMQAVREAGGEPVPISLRLDDDALAGLLTEMDAFVLPGSPADIDPERYGAKRNLKTAAADTQRERTDWAIYKHAFATHKPVLSICYGAQSLNVFLGGSLIQDIPSEIEGAMQHAKHPTGEVGGKPADDPEHEIRLAPGTKLLEVARAAHGEIPGKPGFAIVNSSHHQAIFEPGRGLRIAAASPDGIIEAVEYVGADEQGSAVSAGDSADWIFGMQWHPERMAHELPGGAFAAALFRALVRAAAGVAPQAT
jgi:putative glutamine amidotransferase